MRKELFTHMRNQAAGLSTGGSDRLLTHPREQQEGCACASPTRSMRMTHILMTTLLIAIVILLSTPAVTRAAEIINTARLIGNTLILSESSVTVSTVRRTPAEIVFLRYAPTTLEAERIPVTTTSYRSGGSPSDPFTPIAPPQQLSGTLIDLSQPLPLVETEAYHLGEALFLHLTDHDQNRDPNRAETIFVTLTVVKTGDSEILRLTETGVNSGIFTGYIQSNTGSAISFDGDLTVTENSRVEATYTDIADHTDTAVSAVLVDPFGIVFDSLTGQPVDGATVTLINTVTGSPATVLGDDGFSAYPATVISGVQTSDSSGRTYSPPDGGFRFPLVSPGSYRLEITPPTGYTAPSTVATAALQTLPGAPFAIETGSRGEVFIINPGPTIHIDIPVDPGNMGLWVEKTANKSQAAIGDFIAYRVTVENFDASASATSVSVTDALPLGFSYVQGSTRIDGIAVTDPDIHHDGRTLTFNVGNVLAQSSIEISYVTEITARTKPGKQKNIAVAASENGLTSNTTSAVVEIREEFLHSKSLLSGRVMIGECEQPDTELDGLDNVRIYLEDGSYIVTDERGNYHFEGIEPGTHVVQLDLKSLPEGYQAIACEDNSQFAGRNFSQFIDIQGGTLWRADFHVNLKKDDNQKERVAPQSLETNGKKKPASALKRKPKKLTGGILYPRDNQPLANRISSVRITLSSKLKVRLTLDGTEISSKRIGFRMKDEETGRTLYTYIGIDFGDKGNHLLKLEGMGPFGNARFKQEFTIIRTGDIAEIRVIGSADNVADGITPVKVKLQLRDSNGQEIKAATKLLLLEGNLKPVDSGNEFEQSTGESSYIDIDMQGYAHFQPTQNSGLYTATLGFGDKTVEIETYVKPQMRDWIMVGFAEGTVGYNTLSGNRDNLDFSGIEEEFYSDGQVKFFAKGAIKGKWLLTMAYDSDKQNRDGESLQQIIDPNAYYPLYGDETQQNYEAASARKIFVKLERDQFYALFGDMQTGLSQTELSSYSRSMNGFKSEMQGERFEYNLFVAETRQGFSKDEIRGDGTSGHYALSHQKLVVNSEEITIETRDRFRSENIISTKTLQRHVDYTIDYRDGTVFFKRPISSKDAGFNPIFIVARYETHVSDSSELNYGGRVAVKFFDQKLEIGASHVHEKSGGDEGELTGVDATLKLNENNKLRLEAATTDTETETTQASGDAWLAEFEHSSDDLMAKLYYRQQDGEFGLGQQNGSESGTRKYGVEGSYRINDKATVTALAYHEDNLGTDAERDVMELAADLKLKQLSLNSGLRSAQDTLGDGTKKESLQLLTGANWTTANNKLTLRVNHEQSLGSHDENSDYPTLTLLGADYKLNPSVSLFIEQEFSRSADKETEGTRAGFKATPWQGGDAQTSIEQQIDENGTRMFALFGLGQSWKINEKWSIDANLDRSYTLKDDSSYDFNGNVPAAHGSTEDFTAVSLGATYQQKEWSWANRVEVHHTETKDKYNFLSELVGKVRDGVSASARYNGFYTDDVDSESLEQELRLGLAYRPVASRWILLDRLDAQYQKNDSATTSDTSWRLINNLHANYKVNRKWQIAPYYGLKYVRENFDGDDYSGVTDLLALETRYNLTSRWDIGLHGSVLHSWNSSQLDYSAGGSVGFRAMTNTWISLGYNATGFTDEDFSTANYTSQGFYLRFRIKFDQNSVKDALTWLNRK